MRGELSAIGELVLRGTRIVLPKQLRCQALRLAHEGHPGIVAMKQRLCTKVWWPVWKAKWCKIQHRIFQSHSTSTIKFKIMYSSKSTSVILFNLRNLINFKER